MSDHVLDIELAMIAKVKLATRVVNAGNVPYFNIVDVFRGEEAEVFLDLIRETAPSCWFRFDRGLNKSAEFMNANAIGQAVMEGTTSDNEGLIWSVFVCAKSLRATKELSQGGPGVIGAYDMMNVLIGPPQSPWTTLGQLRGFKPTPISEPLVFVGRKLLGQTTTAAAYEIQFRTRVQLT